MADISNNSKNIVNRKKRISIHNLIKILNIVKTKELWHTKDVDLFIKLYNYAKLNCKM